MEIAYEYDLFLSWTGADRELKNGIKQYFAANYPDLKIYDSDEKCKGKYREDYCANLQKSKVYLLILTDNLRSRPDKSYLSEVRSEVDLARDLEACGDLNIIILCFSHFFRYSTPFRDTSDALGWYFYTATRGYSRIDASLDEQGAPDAVSLEKLGADVADFVKRRDAGTPAISQRPTFEIQTDSLSEDATFRGRADELDEIERAYKEGARVVVLSGLGGMGKTKIAEQFARNAQERNMLKCLQVVKVQELAEERNGLKLLVSGTRYTKALTDAMAQFNPEERYERKLSALRDLPEYTLVVLDNYNTLGAGGLEDLMRFLNCRVLVTTRVQAEEDELGAGVKVVHVGRMPADQSYEIFTATSGRNIERDKFETLYEALGGHTITLCILAKILREQKSADIDKLFGSSIEDLSAKTDFRHNENISTDTLLGHLKALYDCSNLDDDCKAVLADMCLLGDGKISVRTLLEVTEMHDENAVLTLKKLGWLESSIINGEEWVYLHPILSELVFATEKPDAQSAADIINYICRSYDDMKSGLSYEDAQVTQDKLYFALKRVASSTGDLDERLWERFGEISHFLGQAEDLKAKSDALIPHLPQPAAEIVQSHCDMVTLECRPTDIEILGKFVDSLDSHADNYKWVMRSLSVSSGYLVPQEGLREKLVSVMQKAAQVASECEDDLGMLSIAQFYTNIDSRSAVRDLKKYVRKRIKKGEKNGTVKAIESLIYSLSTLDDGTDNWQKKVPEILESPYGKSAIKLVLRHPINVFKANRVVKTAAKLPEDDPMKPYWEATQATINSFIYEDKLDAVHLFEAAIHIYNLQRENGLTMASIDKTVMGILELIKTCPIYMQSEVRKLASITSLDSENATMGDFSRLHVAFLFNSHNNDKTALIQSRLLLDAERKWHSNNHNTVVAALVRHANTCVTFGRNEEAVSYFAEAYEILKENAPVSQPMIEVGSAILQNPDCGLLGYAKLSEIYDSLLAANPGDRFGQSIATNDFMVALYNFAKKRASLTRFALSHSDVHSFLADGIDKYVFTRLSAYYDDLTPTNWNPESFSAFVATLGTLTFTQKQANDITAALTDAKVGSVFKLIAALTQAARDRLDFFYEDCVNKHASPQEIEAEMILKKLSDVKYEHKNLCDPKVLAEIRDEVLNLILKATVNKNPYPKRPDAVLERIGNTYFKDFTSAVADFAKAFDRLAEGVSRMVDYCDNINSYAAKYHNYVSIRLCDAYTVISMSRALIAIPTFDSLSQKIAACAREIAKNGATRSARGNAQVLLAELPADELKFYGQNDKLNCAQKFKLYLKVLDTCFKYRSSVNGTYKAAFAEVQSDSVGAGHEVHYWIYALVGKRTKQTAQVYSMADQLVAEKRISPWATIGSVVSKSYKDGFGISDNEFYRIAGSRSGRKKYCIKALTKILTAALEKTEELINAIGTTTYKIPELKSLKRPE